MPRGSPIVDGLFQAAVVELSGCKRPPGPQSWKYLLSGKHLLIPGLNKIKQKSFKHSLSDFHIYKALHISYRQAQCVVFFVLSVFVCRIPFSWSFP